MLRSFFPPPTAAFFCFSFSSSCIWNTLSISNTTAPAILQLIFCLDSTLGYHVELTCYFSLAAKFPLTFKVKNLQVAAAQPHCDVCEVIFSCATLSVSSITSLQPSCVLRSTRSLGGWLNGNAGGWGKARSAGKEQRVVVRVGWRSWEKWKGDNEWFVTVRELEGKYAGIW